MFEPLKFYYTKLASLGIKFINIEKKSETVQEGEACRASSTCFINLKSKDTNMVFSISKTQYNDLGFQHLHRDLANVIA